MKSLKFRLISYLLVVNIIVLISCAFLLRNQIEDYNKYIKSTYQSVLDINIERVDNMLENAETTILSKRTVSFLDEHTSAKKDSSDLFYFYQSVLSDLEEMCAGNPTYLSFYFFNREDNYLIYTKNSKFVASLYDEFSDSLKRIYQKQGTMDGWSVETIDGNMLLVFHYSIGSDMLGIFVNVDSMKSALEISLPEGQNLFLYSGDQELSEKEKRKAADWNYVLCGFRHLINAVYYYENPGLAIFTNEAFGIVILMIVFLILLVPVTLSMMANYIFKPLNNITYGLQYVQKNDLTYRLNERNVSTEFANVNRNFNYMVKALDDLNKKVEQEQEAKRQMELAWLHHQIRPHFILNNLNQIYTLADRHEDEQVKNLSLALSDYMRYVLRTDEQLLTIGEELRHIRNYLSIYKLSHPDNFEYMISCPYEVEHHLMPTYLINTILENCLQHAMSNKKRLKICILFTESYENGKHKLVLTIEDDGIGYSEKMLRHVNSFQDFSNYISSHIGLRNIKYRLYLIYGDEAQMVIYNRESGGAGVKVTFPFEKGSEL